MSTVAGDITREVNAQVMRRWRVIDPLLPLPVAPEPGCGATLIVAGADGRPAAIGACEHWTGESGSLDPTWGAARRFRLTTWIADLDVAGVLDLLLSQWHDHLADVPDADGMDTAAVVTWASRDIGGVRTLQRHGLMPLGVIAARPTSPRAIGMAPRSRRWAAEPARQGLDIRRAGPADIEAVTRLGLEVIRFDAHFGGVTERPETADALRVETTDLLAGPESWVWLAESDGTPMGLLAAERPESTGWIAPMVGLAPVAYIMLTYVLPGERGRGVGAALAARLHNDVEAAGVPITLLHYEQTNPLSAPFWGQQGYRPLWTSWEARPASALR